MNLLFQSYIWLVRTKSDKPVDFLCVTGKFNVFLKVSYMTS